jgi:GNAT superfamily N-acetyltransferase
VDIETRDDWRIEVVTTGEQLEALAAVATAIAPERPYTAAELEHGERTFPGALWLLAWAGSTPVGYGTAGRIYVYAADFDGAWAEIGVGDGSRQRGIGSELYRRLSAHAAAMGKKALHVPTSEARPEAIGWLERRGFVEYERSRAVALDLVGAQVLPVDAPAGVEITTVAERPDLLGALHLLAEATLRDIPGSDEPHTAGTLEEFIAYDIEGPMRRREAIFIALVDGEVAGYASLGFPGARPAMAWHDMTGVARPFRGRGIAGALKRAQIAWAAENGIVTLETENNVENAPMRAINAALGYRPEPDQIILRGPLAASE